MKNIKEEEAQNVKELAIPAEDTYYAGFVRNKHGIWHCASVQREKDLAIQDLRKFWSGYDEYLLLSFNLPF